MTQLETRTEPMVVNFGPHHPSMHGVLRLVVTLDGEDVVDCEPVIGYLHRGMEKIAENRTNVMFVPYVSRMDYAAGMFYEAIVVNAPERLADVPVPKRASYIRVLMLELNRIANHLLWLGPFLADVGAQTPFFYIFREREMIYDLLGSGHRPAPDQQQLLPHRRGGRRPALGLAGEVRGLLQLVWPQDSMNTKN
jgi:NAD(P)H-quinone oxidoreductase subunit H